jgi:hypothetical protein
MQNTALLCLGSRSERENVVGGALKESRIPSLDVARAQLNGASPSPPHPPTMARRTSNHTAVEYLMTAPPNIESPLVLLLRPNTALGPSLREKPRPTPIPQPLSEPPHHSSIIKSLVRSIVYTSMYNRRKPTQRRRNKRRRPMRSIHRPLQLWMQHEDATCKNEEGDHAKVDALVHRRIAELYIYPRDKGGQD